jgi:hypothetical protein
MLFLVPSICDVKRDLRDSSGSYTKTVCTIYQEKNYDNAVATCADNGMKIYNAASTTDANAMLSYSDINWPYGSFWTEGKFGLNCTAVTNDNKLNFYMTRITCSTPTYFHCEYTCKLSFITKIMKMLLQSCFQRPNTSSQTILLRVSQIISLFIFKPVTQSLFSTLPRMQNTQESQELARSASQNDLFNRN